MKPNLLILLAALIWGGCSSSQSEHPKDVLSPEELTALLIKIYVAEAKADNLPYAKDSSIKYFAPFEQKLLKSQNIPDSVLKKTYQYYMSHSQELEKIYDVVIDSLILREQSTVEKLVE